MIVNLYEGQGVARGEDTNVIYNDKGVFSGDNDFTYLYGGPPTITLGGASASGTGTIKLGGTTGSGAINSNALALVSLTGITSSSGTGIWNHTGSFNAAGILSSSSNAQLAGTTNSGVTINGGNNFAYISLFNQAQAVNDRTGELIFISGQLQLRFLNDAHSAAVIPLSVTGGQATGITAIDSNSGSGRWTHTGDFVAYRSGGNAVVLAGAPGGSAPTITTEGANVNVSLQINTKGAGGINLNANTNVIGTFVSTAPAILSSGYSISSLPAGTIGMRAFVTNGKDTTPTFLESVGTTTGTKSWPVFHNGTEWLYA